MEKLKNVSLLEVDGIGPKNQKLYNKLDIHSVYDLLEYYPYRYDDLSYEDLNNLESPKRLIVTGIVQNRTHLVRGKVNYFKFILQTSTTQTTVYVFNRMFLKRLIDIGKEISVIGKYNPQTNTLNAEEIIFKDIEKVKLFVPIYKMTEGLTSKQINKNIKQAFKQFNDEIDDLLPSNLINEYKLVTKKEGYRLLHFPKNNNEVLHGLRRAKYEELFIFMLKINALKIENKRVDKFSKKIFDEVKVNKYVKSLPFELTKSQLKVVEDIKKDLISPINMHRIVQGDVGSGKTVVASIGVYMSYLAGYQSTLMAPTEILATQHYNTLFNFLNHFGVKIELLTGSTPQKDKQKIYYKLENGECDLVVGTHALFQNNVKYKKLGLVITDEQHRFGVNQRKALNEKGNNVDVLYLSATPIPRTLALTVFGDLDVSELKTLPQGRKNIKTYLKTSKNIKEVLQLIYDTVKRKEQVYVVAPLIDVSENIDNIDATTLYHKLQIAFKDHVKMDLLHGKMTQDKKDNIMRLFKDKEIDLLVSTTVIEVGVDNPNATLMVIFDAYKFGLAQLHQLRGRVGRGEKESKCVLISDNETERLKIMTTTNDGFILSEADLKLRGPGDFFGSRQSGLLNFKVSDIIKDKKILEIASNDAFNLLHSNEFYFDEKYVKLKEIVDDILLNGVE